MMHHRTIKTVSALLFGIFAVLGLGACADGLNISRVQDPEDAAAEDENEQKLIELSADDIRQPLNRDFDSSELPIPGAVRPLPKAPDVKQIERTLFSETIPTSGLSTNVALTFSNAELELMARTGARQASGAIRQALTPPPKMDGVSSPLNYASEIFRLNQLGVRTSRR